MRGSFVRFFNAFLEFPASSAHTQNLRQRFEKDIGEALGFGQRLIPKPARGCRRPAGDHDSYQE
jgi:hypothetical protein